MAFAAVYTSDLRRAAETAALALAAAGRPAGEAVPDARLREKGAGEMEGRPLGACERAARAAGAAPRQFRPRGGESWEDVAVRTR